MKEYNEEEVKARLEKAVDEMMKDFKPMFVGVENSPLSRMPEIYCRNCGRSVYVGRCCPAPDIQTVERPNPETMKEATEFVELLGRAETRTLSPESFDRLRMLVEQPAEPSPALVELMTRERKFKREY